MNDINVTLTAKWQLISNPIYKVTECNRLVNTKTSKLLRYDTRGYYINGKYYKKNDIRNMVELIPKEVYCPF